MASPQASDPASPQVRFFRGSRPPSPSLFPGMLNLYAVNEKLRQRTATPETQTSETERERTRKLFDELTELGGIPLRPWVDYRAEDLPEGQRGDDNREDCIRSLYRKDTEYWQTQLRLWTRFAKRRSQDREPDLRSLDPIDVTAAFTAYLRGHLQRDMQDRAKPGCEVWSSYSHMTSQRDLIEDIVESLPPAEALLRQLRKEKGDENTLPEVTNEGLVKEYNVPHRRVWMDLWSHSQQSLPPSEPVSPHAPKRQRDDIGEEEKDARPSKRIASGSKPSADTTRSNHQRRQKKRSPNSTTGHWGRGTQAPGDFACHGFKTGG